MLVRWLLIALTFSFSVEAADAGGVSAARAKLSEAKLLARNFYREDASELLWEIFIDGESIGATEEEIAEAAFFITEYNGFKDHKEELYLLSWASEKQFAPAMYKLGHTMTYDLERFFARKVSGEILVEYPTIPSLEQADDLIKAAAELGNPDALRRVSYWYREGKKGHLSDPFYAQELADTAYNNDLIIGRSGEPWALIDLVTDFGFPGRHEGERFTLFEEAIAQVKSQPGGGDATSAFSIARFFEDSEALSVDQRRDGQYQWLLHGLRKVNPERLDYYIGDLSDFLLGEKFLEENTEQLDVVAAHALLNFKATKFDSKYAREDRDKLQRKMSEGQLRESLAMARVCMERDISACLDGIDAHYRAAGH